MLLQDMKIVCRVEHHTPGYTFLHDFALTPTHYILVQNPVALQPTNFLLGKERAAASVKWLDGKPAEVHLVGRPKVEAPDTSLAKPGSLQRQQQHNYQQQPFKQQQDAEQRQQLTFEQQQGAFESSAGQKHVHVEPAHIMTHAQKRGKQCQQHEQQQRHQPEHFMAEVCYCIWCLGLPHCNLWLHMRMEQSHPH